MAETKYIATKQKTVFEADQAFGLKDDSGRAIGYRVKIIEMGWRAYGSRVDPVCWSRTNEAFQVETSTMRDNSDFGSWTAPGKADSLEQAIAIARRRRDGALKRARKQFGCWAAS